MKSESSMKKSCASCSIHGYSAEICKLHIRQQKKCKAENFGRKPRWQRWGNSALIGAGLGVGGAFACMAVAPLLGAPVLLGHMVAAQIAAGAAGAGAGSRMALEAGRRRKKQERHGKRRLGKNLLITRMKMRRKRSND